MVLRNRGGETREMAIKPSGAGGGELLVDKRFIEREVREGCLVIDGAGIHR